MLLIWLATEEQPHIWKATGLHMTPDSCLFHFNCSRGCCFGYHSSTYLKARNTSARGNIVDSMWLCRGGWCVLVSNRVSGLYGLKKQATNWENVSLTGFYFLERKHEGVYWLQWINELLIQAAGRFRKKINWRNKWLYLKVWKETLFKVKPLQIWWQHWRFLLTAEH